MLKVVGVTGQSADGVSLSFDELLVEEVSHLRVVTMGGCLGVVRLMGMRVCLMQTVRLHGEGLLVLQGDGQRLQFVELDDVHGDRLLLHEVVFPATLRDVLNQFDGIVPGLVGQSAELFLEAGTVLDVRAEVGGEQHIFVGLGQLLVGVVLQSLLVDHEVGVDGVAVDQDIFVVLKGREEKEKLLFYFFSKLGY